MVIGDRWWTDDDAKIMARVFGRQQLADLSHPTWDWTPTMADWRDARVMDLLTWCPASGLLAKRVALRLQGEQIES